MLKKLLIVLMLVMVFGVGYTMAQQYEVDIDSDGNMDTELTIAPGSQFCFDVYLTDATLGEPFAGGVYIDYQSSVSLVSYVSSTQAVPPWTAGPTADEPDGPGTFWTKVLNLGGANVSDGAGNILITTICFDCLGTGDVSFDLMAEVNPAYWTSPYDDASINANTLSPTLVVHQNASATTSSTTTTADSTTTTAVSTTTTAGCPPDLPIDCGNGLCCPLELPVCGSGSLEDFCLPEDTSTTTTTEETTTTTTEETTTTTAESTTTTIASGEVCSDNYPVDCDNGWCCPLDLPICGYGSFEGYCFNEDPLDTTTTTSICPVESIFGEHAEQTELLRYFRDNLLSQTPQGREIIRLYYLWSPAIVQAMEEDEEFKQEIKEMVDGVLELIE